MEIRVSRPARNIFAGLRDWPKTLPAFAFGNGRFYHFEFVLDGRRRRGSTGTPNKPQAIAEERLQRERLKKSYSQILEEENREQRRKTIQQAADEFLADYKLKHESATFAVYALGHVSKLRGASLVVEIHRMS